VVARAVRWVLLRFTPAEASKQVAVADIALLGRQAAPASVYTFKVSPGDLPAHLKPLDRLAEGDDPVTPDDQKLLADAKNGKFTTWAFTDAALLASGVAATAQPAPHR